MKLICIRHAAAVERTGGVSEERRYLTPEGRVFFRKTARTMLKNGIDPDLILTSPLLRAVQTADILAEKLNYTGPLAVAEELAPGFDLNLLEQLVNEHSSVDQLVLVGHEPDLSSLIAALLGLPAGFNLKKGAAVKLTVNPKALQAPASFKWLASGRKLLASPEEACAR